MPYENSHSHWYKKSVWSVIAMLVVTSPTIIVREIPPKIDDLFIFSVLVERPPNISLSTAIMTSAYRNNYQY